MAGERCHDPGLLVTSGASVAEMHPVPQILRDVAIDIRIRQEDVRFEEGAADLLL